jgi:hypothetical protein
MTVTGSSTASNNFPLNKPEKREASGSLFLFDSSPLYGLLYFSSHISPAFIAAHTPFIPPISIAGNFMHIAW